MAKIDVTVDVAAGKAAIDALTVALNATNSRIEQLNVTSANFNKQGKLITATVESQTSAFGKVIQQLRLKKGALEVVSSKYVENAKAARAAADAAVDAANRAASAQARYDKVDAERAARTQQRAEKEIAKREVAYQRDISNAAKAAQKKVEDEQKEADRIEKHGTRLGGIFQRVQRDLTQFAAFKAFRLIADGIESGIVAAKDFQIQLSLIRTLSQGVEQQSFAKFGRDVRGVSDASGFNIKDVGKAFYDTTSNQIAKGAGVAGFVKVATEFARVTGSELPDSVNLLSSAINSYGLSSADAERLSAVFFKTIDEGRIVASELANTFGRVGVLANGLGVSFEDVNATLAVTTQKGFKTADAMTLLTNLLIKLEKPTDATKNFLQNVLGVDSGEAAITLLGGLPQLMRRIVQETKAGNVEVSAFFDEIRGRKQFAVFEQSIDQIESFSNKLKDTGRVVSEYKKAIEIRGESPADKLVKEANKLGNVFKVDVGQSLLKVAADLLAFTGGVDTVTERLSGISTLTKGAAISFGVYAAGAGVAAIANSSLAASFLVLGRAALVATPLLITAAATVSAYYLLERKLSGNRSAGQFGSNIDLTALDATISAVERYKQSVSGISRESDPFERISKSKEGINTTFQDAIKLISSANLANNKFLDEAKTKSHSVSESLKVSFASFTDKVKDGISTLKKGVTEASAEIERSLKSALKFNESLDEKLFNTKLKYANEDFGNQKQLVLQERQIGLQQKADKLFKEGTEESIAEARRLYDTLAQNETDLFDLKVEQSKKNLERDPYGGDGQRILSVDTAPLQQKLADLAAKRAASEGQIQASKQAQIATNEKLIVREEERLRSLEAAFKKYEQFDILDKSGGVKKEFQDVSGKFDTAKFQTATSALEDDIRKSAGGTTNERFQLEVLLSQKRLATSQLAGAVERQENLRTFEARLANERDVALKKQEDIKKERVERLAAQDATLAALSQKQNEIRGFADIVGKGGKVTDQDKAVIDSAINQYNDAFVRLRDNLKVKDGVSYLDPNRINEVGEAYNFVLDKITEIRNRIGKAGNLIQDTPSGQLTIGGARAGTAQQLKEAISNSAALSSGTFEENFVNDQFANKVKAPLDELKKQFPDLLKAAETNLPSINQKFRDLANGGVEDLKKQLIEIQKLIPKGLPAGEAKPGRVGALEGDVAYAATGGVVGQFPGQARGQDKYPIWAARGETIISAATSEMYRPMLDAIMQRRIPQYMAEGGVVGGDTQIGDINITVNGATTNNDTARVIGNRLERQLRLNNVQLGRRKK